MRRKSRGRSSIKKKIVSLVAIGMALAYVYGAGRAVSWNPFTIHRVWEARKFEKSLAGEIYGRKCFGRCGYKGFGEMFRHAHAYNEIFWEHGLAEINGKEGIQAEEYVYAIEKITGKKVEISDRDIRDSYGLDVVKRFLHNLDTSELEGAIENWDSDGKIEEKPEPVKRALNNFV